MSAVTASSSSVAPGAGALLREWRRRRRLSQLDLAVSAEVSARHLSFVETGRARPSRELVTHLAEHLNVPLRDRNSLLLAAGYAPAYAQTPIEAHEMAPVRDALSTIVVGHEPFPALVVDRGWDVVTANSIALRLLSADVAPALLGPPTNVMRASLHPDGLAPRIVNFGEWAEHLLDRLDRQIAVSGACELVALADELRTYPGVTRTHRSPDLASRLFVPLVILHGGHELRFLSTVATFGTALDVTVAELSIESFFPADPETAARLGAVPARRSPTGASETQEGPRADTAP